MGTNRGCIAPPTCVLCAQLFCPMRCEFPSSQIVGCVNDKQACIDCSHLVIVRVRLEPRIWVGYAEGSPFASPLLSSTDFLAFMCPMVKTLRLDNMKVSITASQFAALCELSMLERLYVGSNPSEGEVLSASHCCSQRFCCCCSEHSCIFNTTCLPLAM